MAFQYAQNRRSVKNIILHSVTSCQVRTKTNFYTVARTMIHAAIAIYHYI